MKEGATVILPPSKSESNRYLILDALAGSKSNIKNLSSSDDTVLLQRALKTRAKKVYVGNAGTALRFLTAYFAISGKNKILEGTARMHERPVGELVRALRQLGAKINFLKKSGYPPLEFEGFNYSGVNTLEINSSTSSQFISALMIIGPSMPHGLNLKLKGTIVSQPYIELTAKLMSQFGVEVLKRGKLIAIPPGKYKPQSVVVDGDWSSAAFWYTFFRLSGNKRLKLLGLSHEPVQGDSRLISLMEKFGVQSTPVKNGYELKSIASKSWKEIDLLDNPDLAQPLIVLASLLGKGGAFSGLNTLPFKETDRIKALTMELAKLNCKMEKIAAGSYKLIPGKGKIGQPTIETYDDHRMAMSFASVCLLSQVGISNPAVVNKSYPEFWEALNAVLIPD